MTVERRFETREELAEELATRVAAELEEGIAERGQASLVVSGGSTPAPFFRALRARRLAWERVTVTLADDRWVPPENERSNERLVRNELLIGAASSARFVGLAHGATAEAPPEAGVAACEQALHEVPRPFDVVVLGMGTDGHTASLFPGAEETPRALDPSATALCAVVNPAGGLEPRLSLTLPALASSRHLYLHITGDEKLRVYRRAAHDLPVGAVLRAAREQAEVYWAP